MNKGLQGKRILFIGQVFYDYHDRIITQLQSMGAKVVFFENKMFREDPSIYPKSLISTVKRLLNPGYKKEYIRYIINSVKDVEFDILFCIGGFSITQDLVDSLKKRNSEMRAIIYFWDSFEVWPYAHLINAFDDVYSFERTDVEKYNIKYQPLFFSELKDQWIPSIVERTRDLLYVGSVGPMSSNRFKLLATFDQVCKKYKLNYLLYLLYTRPKQNGFVQLINNVRRLFDSTYSTFIKNLDFHQKNYKFIKNKPLGGIELKELLLSTKCVIDIQVPGQTGLTMRTIESLSLGCKLLTTNAAVTKEPFYDPEWIQVFNELDVSPNIEFISAVPAKKIDIEHLTLENWLKNLLGYKLM